MTIKERIKKFFKGKYRTELTCDNCKKTKIISIEKGVTILQHKRTNRCPNCGCRYEHTLANALEDTK